MAEPTHPFEAAIFTRWPQSSWSGVTGVVACSGGADSTALLAALSRLAPAGSTLIVAHFNHRLRGEDSDADEAFVVELAAKLGLRSIVGRANRAGMLLDSEPVARDEATLRAERYAFLERAAGDAGARWIATAHTADDQTETVLHRLCRGAGPEGLRGIRPSRPLGHDLVLCRPLLGVTRVEVLAYLAALGQTYRHDRSNDTGDYTRNRIRREVLPLLEAAVHPAATANIRRAAEQFAELADLADTLAAQAFEGVVRISAGECRVDRGALRALPPAVGRQVLRQLAARQRWLLRDWTAEHWRRLYHEAVEAVPPGQRRRASYPGGVTLQADASHVMLEVRR